MKRKGRFVSDMVSLIFLFVMTSLLAIFQFQAWLKKKNLFSFGTFSIAIVYVIMMRKSIKKHFEDEK